RAWLRSGSGRAMRRARLALPSAEATDATSARGGRWEGMNGRSVALVTCVVLTGCTGVAPLPPRAVLLNAAGADALARGDLSTAEAELSVALEYSPRFVEGWVNLG